jgi:hypothetical protein
MGDAAVRGAYAPGTRLAILRGRAVDLVSTRLGITDPAGRQALGQAYDVTARYSAPFMTKVASDMLVDLKAEVAANPDRSIVFVGRDGHSLAVAMRPLDPQFVDTHTQEVVLSRAVVDAAIQDVQTNTRTSFPEIDGFRQAADKVSSESVDGAMQRLTEYLQNSDVPVGRPGSEVTLVDTSYKGTVQELLAAAYPDTSFHGRYVFFGASPADPHPGTKVGYALHLEVDRGSTGIPLDHLPADPRLTFAHRDAIATIEETLHGPLSSPRAIGPDGPVHQFQRFDPEPLRGLNPVGVGDVYIDPLVREGVKHVNLIAVHDYAQHIADVRMLGGDWHGQLDQGYAGFQHQVQAWIGGGDADPKFANVMDSFVRRSDKGLVASLQTAIHHAGLTSDQANAVWTKYGRLGTLPKRQAFVDHFRLGHP